MYYLTGHDFGKRSYQFRETFFSLPQIKKVFIISDLKKLNINDYDQIKSQLKVHKKEYKIISLNELCKIPDNMYILHEYISDKRFTSFINKRINKLIVLDNWAMDLNFQNQKYAIVKSKLTYEIAKNKAKKKKYILPAKILEIGPIQHDPRFVVEDFRKNKKIGLFFKSLGAFKKKSRLWLKSKLLGDINHNLHQNLIKRIVRELKSYELIIFLHPTTLDSNEEDVDFFKELGIKDYQFRTDMNSISEINIGIGINTHSSMDCNWFKVPFIQVKSNFIYTPIDTREFIDFKGFQYGQFIFGNKIFPIICGKEVKIDKLKKAISDININLPDKDIEQCSSFILGPKLSLTDRLKQISEFLNNLD